MGFKITSHVLASRLELLCTMAFRSVLLFFSLCHFTSGQQNNSLRTVLSWSSNGQLMILFLGTLTFPSSASSPLSAIASIAGIAYIALHWITGGRQQTQTSRLWWSVLQCRSQISSAVDHYIISCRLIFPSHHSNFEWWFYSCKHSCI